MKILIYLTGLVTSMMMAVGWAMGTLHLSGLGEFSPYQLSTYGFMGFAILYLPAVTLFRFKEKTSMGQIERIRLSVGLFCSMVTFVALLFKALSYSGANLMLIVGVGTFIFAFLPALFFSLYKESKVEF